MYKSIHKLTCKRLIYYYVNKCKGLTSENRFCSLKSCIYANLYINGLYSFYIDLYI